MCVDVLFCFLIFIIFHRVHVAPMLAMDTLRCAQVARERCAFVFLYFISCFFIFSLYFVVWTETQNVVVACASEVECCVERPFAFPCSLKPGATGRYIETATQTSWWFCVGNCAKQLYGWVKDADIIACNRNQQVSTRNIGSRDDCVALLIFIA